MFEQAQQTSRKVSQSAGPVAVRVEPGEGGHKGRREQAALSKLPELITRADNLRLRSLATEGTVHLGEALLSAKDHAKARSELESVLSLAEKLQLRSVAANAHYLLAMTLSQAGDKPGAESHALRPASSSTRFVPTRGRTTS